MDIVSGISMMVAVLATAGAVVAVVYVLLKKYFDQQVEERNLEWKDRKRKDYLPLQVQAYERFILYLERIHPERLVFRVSKPGMNARMLQSDILKVIREEFDHNLAQQLYIGENAWESVKAAREETINILTVAAERVHKDASAMEFSQSILEVTATMETLPTDMAIRILKKEFRGKLSS